MIKSYVKVAWRNLLRNKMYSLINIGGLATGMAVAMMIGLWVYDEISYNQSHTNFERIAQVYRSHTEPVEQKTISLFGFPQPFPKVLTEKYRHLFKHVVILWWDAEYTLHVGEDNFIRNGQFVSDGVIDMFSLKMLRGSNESLRDPKAIIISQSTAEAIFGEKDPVNQLIKLSTGMDAIVTGVYADIAGNSLFSHIQFFGNFEGLKDVRDALKAQENNWGNNSCKILVQLADNITMEQANDAISNLYQQDTPEAVIQHSKKYKTNVWLNPMKNWYLYSEFKDGYPDGGRITFVWLFSIVGVFVLLLACINFINLSTARSEKRAKEVGIRKAIGSVRSQLINQFLSESFLVTIFSLTVAVILVAACLAPFNEIADKHISLPLTNIYFWTVCFAFLLVTSFIAGLYPAFYLSSFQPVKVLKGTLRLGKYAALPRKILVIVQVTVSVVLIIGTMVVYQQIQYAKDRSAGYDRQGLVHIAIHDTDFYKNRWVMRDELQSSGVVDAVAMASSPVTEIWDTWGGFTWKGKNPDTESNFTVTWVNEEYGKTIQWKVLQGRDFSRDLATDVDAVIINKSAANYLGLENPVGEYITHLGDGRQRQIIGVVEDVIITSPYEPVSAGFYWLGNQTEYLSQMLIKLKTGSNVSGALAKIESVQSRITPSTPFDYDFVDDEYDAKFKAEQRIGQLANIFAVLAILISCLGLFGLSSFVAEQKTKEIGVRKIVGASVADIWSLLSKEFVILVLISFIVAVPLAYYYLRLWLLTYDYHTQLNVSTFLFAGGGTLFITLLTISFYTIKAAAANPAKSLRSE